MTTYDINRPWLTLDPWQKEYCFDPDPNQDNFLLCGRQVGKTTAMSIRAVELCVNHYKKGEFVLINSITEKQAYHMLAKSLVYAKEKYSKKVVWKGDDKPTKHRIIFKNGSGILCYAAGETGEGLRGFTIKKIMPDEGSRMTEEYFIAILPALSVVKGSMDIASTPAGKLHKDGSERYFYKCSKNPKFKKHYISAEDCPRHTKEFLEEAKKRLSKLAYAQEMLAMFTDALTTLFPKELLDKVMILDKRTGKLKGDYYLGVDVAGFGGDECTYELFQRMPNEEIHQVDNIVETRNYTHDTSDKIKEINNSYEWIKKIGIDDGGLGFGVFSNLMKDFKTKNKTIPLNNASRVKLFKDGEEKSKALLKEDMYFNLLTLMEQGKVKLLKDDEVRASLSSMQVDEDGKVFGSNSHISEGVNRGVWCAEKEKSLNIFARRF
jgi:hypothetical protein